MRVLEKVSQTFWEDVAGCCSYATFFHAPYWSKLMEKTFSCMDITKGFIFDDGTRVVFPFIRQKQSFFLGIFDDYISGLLYVYGGPIADREMTKQQLDEIIEYINSAFKMYNRVLIRGNPFGQDITPIGFEKIKDLSHVVELFKCENEEELLKSYMKSFRRQIKSAIKSNVLTIKEANTLDEYEKFYGLYQKSKKYWGDNILTDFPLLLFQNIYNMKNKYMKLVTVYYENSMIGGDIILLWNDYCHSWLSYHDREYSKLYGRRYLLHNVFLDCKEKGIRYYDFLQSGGIKGLEFFKRTMGGREYPHNAWMKENNFFKKIRNIKISLLALYKKIKM